MSTAIYGSFVYGAGRYNGLGWNTPITDRAQKDITDKTAKGYFNVSDVYRIEQNCEYIADQLNAIGYPVSITVNTAWSMSKFLYRNDIDRIRDNVNTLINALYKLPGSPDIRYWDSLDWNDANSLEQNILNLDTLLQRMTAVFLRCGDAYGGDQ